MCCHPPQKGKEEIISYYEICCTLRRHPLGSDPKIATYGTIYWISALDNQLIALIRRRNDMMLLFVAILKKDSERSTPKFGVQNLVLLTVKYRELKTWLFPIGRVKRQGFMGSRLARKKSSIVDSKAGTRQEVVSICFQWKLKTAESKNDSPRLEKTMS